MIIRQEQPADYPWTYEVVKTAFASAEHSDGEEHNLVDRLRESKAFIPQLSLVAEDDGNIVGHILFTKIDIGDSVQLALAPLSVLPEYQRQGIGTALILQGHKIAKELGYEYSVVLGSERYYPKFGYLPAQHYSIKPCFNVASENFMACKLKENALDISGVVQYAEEFGID